jgi:hypothetical protein
MNISPFGRINSYKSYLGVVEYCTRYRSSVNVSVFRLAAALPAPTASNLGIFLHMPALWPTPTNRYDDGRRAQLSINPPPALLQSYRCIVVDSIARRYEYYSPCLGWCLVWYTSSDTPPAAEYSAMLFPG